MVEPSWAALRAFDETAAGSHWPAVAVASSEADVPDAEATDLPAGLRESELLTADHVFRLGPRRTLQRLAGVDGQGLRLRGLGARASRVVAATRGDGERARRGDGSDDGDTIEH
jgi:hypothetical protein